MPWQVEPLTQKEMQVLKLLAEGYSNSAMSEKLFVSDSTVRTHLRNINMKLVAQNRTQAVSLARRYGLIR
jgi:LuxR family maltose regulon positive regulatory protein